MSSLSNKTARVGIFYVLLCALALGIAQHERLAACVDFRLALLRKLLQNETLEPDVLFLGSSKTVRGIRPKIAAEVFAANGSELKSGLNLATNGTPRHMNALTLEDYLDHHPAPKVVCIECGTTELIPWPHQLLTNLMTPADALRVIERRPYFVPDSKAYNRMNALNKAGEAFSFEQQASRAQWHLELALKALGRGPEDIARAVFNCLANGWNARGSAATLKALRNPNFAFDPPIEDETLWQQLDADGWYRVPSGSEILIEGRTKVEAVAAKVPIDAMKGERRSEVFRGNQVYAADIEYTNRIVQACRERGIRLVFYLMPEFREATISEDQEAWVRSLGELFVSDWDSLQQPENFADTGHLSDLGAERYTRALAAFLTR